MPHRTTPAQWAQLFNFAGGGLVHMELFPLLLMSSLNPTLFEAISAYLMAYGTHALRPAAADAPLNAIYFETDTTDLFQNQAGTWVQIASIGGGGSGPTIQVNGVDLSDQSILNFLDTASVTWSNPADGDVEATSSGGGGGLVLLDSDTLTGNVSTIPISGLDGNAQGEYILKLKVNNASASGPTYVFRPNAATTNLSGSLHYAATNGTIGVVGSSSTIPICFSGGAGSYWALTMNIHARKNPHSVNTPLLVEGAGGTLGGSILIYTFTSGGRQLESPTWTSIELAANQSNAFGDGPQWFRYALDT